MKNVQLFLKAIFITPFLLAGSVLLIFLTYLAYPIIFLIGVFTILKADSHTSTDDDDEDENWSVPDRHKD